MWLGVGEGWSVVATVTAADRGGRKEEVVKVVGEVYKKGM